MKGMLFCLDKSTTCAYWQQAAESLGSLYGFLHLKDAVDLSYALDNKLHQPLDVHPLVSALLHLQALVGVLAEQVAHFFLVYLQVRCPDQILLLLTCHKTETAVKEPRAILLPMPLQEKSHVVTKQN